MSYRKEKHLSLSGFNQRNNSTKDLQEIAQSALESKIHGLCFSPYDQGQNPGDEIETTDYKSNSTSETTREAKSTGIKIILSKCFISLLSISNGIS